MTALAGYDPRDPYSLDEQVDFTAATRRSIRGWKIAYSPDFDVFPMDRRVTKVVSRAVQVFEEAGAHVEEVKVGITRPQKELSDLWCRLIMPLNVQAFEIFKTGGIDLLKDHRDDFPPEYLRWIDVGYRMSALDFFKDQEIRSEIYDAIQGVLNRYDLLITPTLACLPVDNADDGNTMGPATINGEEVDPLIGWCLTYFINFSGHPAASIPAGLSEDNLPVGHADHRPALRRRGRACGERGLRASAALARHVQDLCREEYLGAFGDRRTYRLATGRCSRATSSSSRPTRTRSQGSSMTPRLELIHGKRLASDEAPQEDLAVIEAVVTANSIMIGNTVEQLALRERYGLNLLAMSRSGSRIAQRLRRVRFQEGDLLVLQGRGERINVAVHSCETPRCGLMRRLGAAQAAPL